MGSTGRPTIRLQDLPVLTLTQKDSMGPKSTTDITLTYLIKSPVTVFRVRTSPTDTTPVPWSLTSGVGSLRL